jgi:Putative transposase/Transposase zinc-binding domain
MSHATLEVADIVRAAGDSFWEKYGSHLAWPHRKVLDAIVRCRTAALGGHRDKCVRCGHQAVSYNSCRNRHCPKCQGNARAKWLLARSRELLPVAYFHVVFTLPHELSPLVLGNKRVLYDLLYSTSAEAMLEMARGRRHLGADIGFLGVLHTWGQTIEHHPHVHYIVPAGGLSADRSRWIQGSSKFFLPVEALSSAFRGKFTEALRHLYRCGKLQFHGSLREIASPAAFSRFMQQLFVHDWVVYAKPPFGGPDQVLNYLARYTHRVAISNHRLLSVSAAEVCFRWKDYAHHGRQRTLTLDSEEFLRRFVQHVLPRGFPRIRYFGFLANRRRARMLPLCRALLYQTPPQETSLPAKPSLWTCPHCHGLMHLVERMTAAQLFFAEKKGKHLLASS